MKITKFEDLSIWKLSIDITKEIYNLTAKKIFSQDYGLKESNKKSNYIC